MTRSLPVKSKFIAAILWIALASLVSAQPTPSATLIASPAPTATSTGTPVVTVQLTSDVVTFFKVAVVVAGIFVAVLAFIGVAFFGFDVRKARSSIQSAENDAVQTSKSARELFEKIKYQQQKLSELERRVEEMGAQVEDIADTELPPPQADQRNNSELLREIISNSSFTWTTIGRLMKKTGLSRDEVLKLARKTPGIEISTSSKTHDYIFRIRNGA
jgi:hypothetical protein